MKRSTRGNHFAKAGQNAPQRRPLTIHWVNAEGITKDKTPSSTRRSRAKRQVERLRNTRQDEGLTPVLQAKSLAR